MIVLKRFFKTLIVCYTKKWHVCYFHSIDSSTYSHQLLYFILQFLVLHTSNSSTSNSQLQYFTSYILVHHFPSSSTSIVTLLCLISFHFSFFSLCISVLSHSHMYTICTIKKSFIPY